MIVGKLAEDSIVAPGLTAKIYPSDMSDGSALSFSYSIDSFDNESLKLSLNFN